MAIKIKSPSEIAAKFATVTPQRSGEYSAGIADTSPSQFEAAAIGGEANYKLAVTQAAAAGTRAKKLVGKGAKWQANAASKGPGRFAEGTSQAADAYSQGFAPYQQVIAGLTLPPKGPKGSPGNIQRVAAVADALRKKKTGA